MQKSTFLALSLSICIVLEKLIFMVYNMVDGSQKILHITKFFKKMQNSINVDHDKCDASPHSSQKSGSLETRISGLDFIVTNRMDIFLDWFT